MKLCELNICDREEKLTDSVWVIMTDKDGALT